MENTVSFALDDTQKIKFEDYDDSEFAIAKLGFLSTRPNSHKLVISEDVLRNDAPSVLGKWLVAKMNYMGTDATTHEPTEHIMGVIPKDQEVEFVEDEDGYLRAYVNVVVSKIYSKEFCKIFSNGEDRPVSVEMKVETENNQGMDDVVNSLNIVGVTVLGANVNPSCPESNIEFVRFAEKAETYFGKTHLTTLKKFAQERKANMENKNSNIAEDFSVIDKEETRKEGESKMTEIEFAAVNIGTLWDSLYNAINHKYEGYNYRIKDIYEEDNQKFAIISKYGEDTLYRLNFSLTEEGLTLAEEIVEVKAEFTPTENIQKFAEPEDVEKYRTFAEDKEDKEEKSEDKSDDEKTEDEDKGEDEDKNEDSEDEDKEAKMSCDEMMAKIEKLEADIAERDDIIMKNNTELDELREFKKTCMEAERASKVEAVMSSVASYMDDKTAEDYRAKGMACEFEALDAWKNEVRSVAFEAVPQKKQKNDEEFTRMSAPIENTKKTGSVWERL